MGAKEQEVDITRIRAVFDQQLSAAFLWVPVMFGLGISVYFGIPAEPSPSQVFLAAGLAGLALLARLFTPTYPAMLLTACALVIAGFVAASSESRRRAAPVLPFRYYGPIEGRIVALDRSPTNAPRITLDSVYLPDHSPSQTPAQIRLSLRGYIAPDTLQAGARITTTGSLAPPGAPVEPGGFDFRRYAWFRQLGAVGYTRNPVIPAAPRGDAGISVRIFQTRMRLSGLIRDRISGQNGAFAAAILTGDRSGIDPDVTRNLRVANLAHLLAISGLHMGLLTGLVFTLVRAVAAMFPAIALRRQVKKIAAVVAIAAGFGYLMLSGANVATQRAFVMSVVVFVAVLIDRPVFTMRAVAVAAMIVLVLRPSALLDVGFQMSFAATAALITAYGALHKHRRPRAGGLLARLSGPVVAVVLTSLIAAMATAPISAFYFNQVSKFGLIANVLSVPVMGILIIPSAVAAILLWPFGLGGVALSVMGKGIGWILYVAGTIAALNAPVIAIKTTAAPVFATILGAMVFGFVWVGRLRLLAVPVLAGALGVWGILPRPEILVAESGRLWSINGQSGRTLNRPRGDGYTARIWLQNDGDTAGQEQAHLRGGISGDKTLSFIDKPPWRLVSYTGTDAKVIAPLCKAHTLIIAPRVTPPDGQCLTAGKTVLRYRGALEILVKARTLTLLGAKDAARGRPWGY